MRLKVLAIYRQLVSIPQCRARLKCDGTRAETRFDLSGKRTNLFKSAGESVHSTTGSRGVRISGSNGSNAGYTMLWGRVKDYWLPTPLVCFPFTSPPVRHRVPSGLNWAIPLYGIASSARTFTLTKVLPADTYRLFGTNISQSNNSNGYINTYKHLHNNLAHNRNQCNCSGDTIEKKYMGRTCSTYGWEEMRIQNFGEETWGKETTWETQA